MCILTHICTHRDHQPILKGQEAMCPQSKPLFYRIISRKSAGPRKCLFNRTVSCRRERVSVCMKHWERVSESDWKRRGRFLSMRSLS